MMSDRVKELVDKCLEELTETEGIAPDGTQNRAEKPQNARKDHRSNGGDNSAHHHG